MIEYPKYQPITQDEQVAFDAAIDKVIYYLYQEAQGYENTYASLRTGYKARAYHHKAVALIDFKIYIEQLFKQVATITD